MSIRYRFGVLFQRKLGRIKNRLAFFYNGYQLRGGDKYYSKARAHQLARQATEEAITIFKEVHVSFTTTSIIHFIDEEDTEPRPI